MAIDKQPLSAFRGLNNVKDPLRLPRGWLTQADNVDVTNTNALVRCRGFTQASTNFAISGAYATKDFKRLYLIDAGELRAMNADMTYEVLRTGLSSAKYYFEEVNGVVYYANGTDFGIIENTGARPWGIEAPVAPGAVPSTGGSLVAGTYQFVCTLADDTGLESGSGSVAACVVADGGRVIVTDIPQVSGYTTNLYGTDRDGTVFFLLVSGVGDSYTRTGGEQLHEELQFWNLDGPRGTLIAEFGGRMHTAEPVPEFDQTVIWMTLPLQYHHFDYSAEAFAVPGTVLMLRATPTALIIGTERAIHAWDGEQLSPLANYGVVPGWHASLSNEQLYFWSLRGLCRALPFVNLTESTVSVPPGLSAGALVIEKDGMRRYVVALHAGGEAYNERN